MLKKVIVVCALFVISRGYGQVSRLALAAWSYPLARVTHDTLTWKQVDSLGRGWCLYEQVTQDSLVPVMCNARMLYVLFSPTVVFPSEWVTETVNAFSVAVDGDTFIATAPSYELESCMHSNDIDHWYQGVPLRKLKQFGSKKTIPRYDNESVMFGDVVTIQTLNRKGVTQLVQTTVRGAIAPIDTLFDPEWSTMHHAYRYGMIRIPFESLSAVTSIAGSPVVSVQGTWIGIVDQLAWVSEGDDILGVYVFCKLFTKNPLSN